MSQSPQHIQQQQFRHQITHIPIGSNAQFPSFTVPLSTANTVGSIPIGISPQGTITLPNNITVQSLLQSLQQQNKKQQQLVQLTQLQLGQHQLQQNHAFQLHFQPTISNNVTTVQQSPQQQILPDSSSQDVGGNSFNLSAQVSQSQTTASTILTQGTITDLKLPKKRQYVRRKGVVSLLNNADDLNASLESTINAVSSPLQIINTDTNISKKNNTIETPKVTEITSPKSSGKKVSQTKSDVSTTKYEEVKVNVVLKDSQSDDDEKLTKKKTNVKKNRKSSEIENVVKETLKNDKDTKNIKFSSKSDSIRKTTKKLLKPEAGNNSREKDLQKISELEKELAKCQKQLNAEKNKVFAQKKKLDKLQSELEKSSDLIQLVQIDLACQKTDNNSLSAQNITLK